jgi:hypothetical protein
MQGKLEHMRIVLALAEAGAGAEAGLIRNMMILNIDPKLQAPPLQIWCYMLIDQLQMRA